MGTADIHYLPRTDRLLMAGERFADLKDELAHDMRNALKGLQSWVTTTVTVQGLTHDKESLQSAPEAVAMAMESDDAQAALAEVLESSRCLMVMVLRQRITAHLYRNMCDTVLCALDHMSTATCFMQVLRTSPCPKVDALRDVIVAAYVQSNAERVSGVRGVR